MLQRQLLCARLLALALGAALLGACADGSDGNDGQRLAAPAPSDPDFPQYSLVQLAPGPDLEQRTQQALIEAQPRTIIELPAGTWEMRGELSVSVDNIVLRGQGMNAAAAAGGTVLRFATQTSGGQAILATGDNIVIEQLAVEDSPGDAIKVEGSNGVTIRKVRVEWTNGPDENNGSYGLYPVQTRNVLIEDSVVRGASDAGVYVGQSEVIIVRRNTVYENVAGIEIENSKFADVYDNDATGNTGGILVFDLPGPPIQGGQATRVFNNRIRDNNTPNFAPAGNIVELVPTGTGVMILANDDIEVFDNEISGNQSAGVVIVSYYINDVFVDKPDYDPVPERIFIHDNRVEGNGYDPQELAAAIKEITLPGGSGAVDLFYDSSGVGTDAGLLLEFPQGLGEDQAICVINNTPGIVLGRANASVLLSLGPSWDAAIGTDAEYFNCTHASLPAVELEPPVDPDNPGSGPQDPLPLCDQPGAGRNTNAFEADCPQLSDYRLFADPANPLAHPNDGLVYDLNTPLFTDYARKFRFVFLPPGTQAAWRDEAAFDFPVGTIIAKTFTIQSDLRDDQSGQELIETRLLIHRQSGWVALPYIWSPDKSDAILTRAGGTQPVAWIDFDGQPRTTDYVIPNTNHCANCHGQDEMLPLGPTARSLHRDYPYDSGSANQLDYWLTHGLLSGAPQSLDAVPAIPLWQDGAASLAARARGYLDVNCAHCHSPTGAARTSGLYLDYFRDFGLDLGACKPPVAAGAGAGNLEYDIVPGDAEASILLYRMASNAPEVRMPELGRSIIHTEGVALVRDWINAMTPRDCAGL